MPINPQTALFSQILAQRQRAPGFAALGQGIERGTNSIVEALQRIADQKRQDAQIRERRESLDARDRMREFGATKRSLVPYVRPEDLSRLLAAQDPSGFEGIQFVGKGGTPSPPPFDPVSAYDNIGSPGQEDAESAPVPDEDIETGLVPAAGDRTGQAPSSQTAGAQPAVKRPAVRTARPFPPVRKKAASNAVRKAMRVDVVNGEIANVDKDPKTRVFQRIAALGKALRESSIRDAIASGMDAATAAAKAIPNTSAEQFVDIVKETLLNNEDQMRAIAPELFKPFDKNGGLIPVPGLIVRRKPVMRSGYVFGAAGMPTDFEVFDRSRGRALTEQEINSLKEEMGGDLVWRPESGERDPVRSGLRSLITGNPTTSVQRQEVFKLGTQPPPARPTTLFMQVPPLAAVRHAHPELGEFAEKEAEKIARAFGLR